jgi:hypothetical protein
MRKLRLTIVVNESQRLPEVGAPIRDRYLINSD